MIRTPVCDLLDIEHPIALGGMGSIYSPDLVAAVSSAGGLSAMGCHYMRPEQIRTGTAAVRERTNKARAEFSSTSMKTALPPLSRCARRRSRSPGRGPSRT